MKVKDLIVALSKLSPNSEIYITQGDHSFSFWYVLTEKEKARDDDSADSFPVIEIGHTNLPSQVITFISGDPRYERLQKKVRG